MFVTSVGNILHKSRNNEDGVSEFCLETVSDDICLLLFKILHLDTTPDCRLCSGFLQAGRSSGVPT
jgi:hypothetical protein